MASLSLLLIGALCMTFAPKVDAMECSNLGISFSCPSFMDKEDKVFCCEGSLNAQYCCDIEDYMKTNAGMVAGIAIAGLVIILIIVLCCCCFCSCCCLARRRVQRGTVLYGPVSGAQVVASPPTYQLVHPPPPTTQAYSPPPYNPNYDAGQPPVNPHYK